MFVFPKIREGIYARDTHLYDMHVIRVALFAQDAGASVVSRSAWFLPVVLAVQHVPQSSV